MTHTNHKHFFKGLFFRVYLYFAIMLSFFAVLIGIIFIKLFEINNMNSYENQLQTQAEVISERITEYVTYEDFADYPTYLGLLDQMELFDVWVVTNPTAVNPLDEEYENIKLQDVEDIKDIEGLLKTVYTGEMESVSYYSKIYQLMVMTVGAPVFNAEDQVVGAVVINSQLENQTKVVNSSEFLIIISIIVALIISFVIAILFARKLSRPISKIRSVAIKLANGEYNNKTNIDQYDEIGDLGRTIDILSDKLKNSDEERSNMEKMRLDFFANISHELRTPITVIRAYLESLVDGIMTDETKIKQSYQRMLIESKGMDRLVGDLLLLSKMENPDFQIDKEPVNLIQVFEDIIRNAHAISMDKHIRFELIKDQDACFMFGDYDRLRQLFMVVLDNAIKFSPEESVITIRITIFDKIRVSIQDQGVGMDEDELPNIFDKFYKSKLHMNKDGSGLGLLIAKNIVSKHEGSIEVNSVKGEGTCFSFVFQPFNIEEENSYCSLRDQ